MESPFSKLYLDLLTRITQEVPGAFVDENKGQYGFENFRAMVSFPAVLIDFPNTPFSNLSNNIQLGNASISISILYDVWENTSSITPEDVRENGLEYYEFEHKIHKALQGWHEDYFTPLDRVNATSQNRNDIGLRIREVFYNSEFEDWSLDTNTTAKLSFNQD